MRANTLTERPARKIQPWVPGDPLAAERLNHPIRALEDLTRTIVPPQQIIPQPNVRNLAASTYAGPFAGRINPGNAAQIQIGPNRENAEVDDIITIGVDRTTKTAVETVSITTTSYVYYAITKSGTAITATLTAGASLPTDDATTFNLILGKAMFNAVDSVVSLWQQYQYGLITEQAALIDAGECT